MMNKKQSSKMQLGKYAFILPAAIVGSLIFGVSNANDNSKTQPVIEVFPSDVQDTLKQKNSKSRTHPNNKNGEKQFIDNIHKTYPTNIQATPVNKTSQKLFQDTIKTKNEPLYIVDGVKQTPENRHNYNPQEIASVNVLKDKAAIASYGKEGKNGVLEVTTNKGEKDPVREITSKNDDKTPIRISTSSVEGISYETGKKATTSVIGIPKSDDEATSLRSGNMSGNVLIFVDGKRSALDQVDPNDIESITVFKGESAIEGFGQEGKDGVIQITTKMR